MRASSWIPWVFVVLWSTGFTGAKLGLPYCGPFTFLAIRMALTLLCFAALLAALRPAWPTFAQARRQWVSGGMLHGGYLGCLFAAIKLGVPAGLAALIMGMQPLLTALISWRLGEKRFRAIQWLGMALGLAGTALVIAGSKGVALAGGAGAAFVIAGLLLITGGTLYQRYRGGGAHPVAGAFHQYLSALAVTGTLALLFERGERVVWSGDFIFALAWSVAMLSVLAVLLLLRMLRDGDVSRVAAYLYLVPGLTAIQAWWLFDERLSPVAMGGIVLAAVGVALVLRGGDFRLPGRLKGGRN
ncbi:EamA family transporter [Chromobacterium violaceum]|uniref:DMT family transporter n=1 Tax=Chromobacterium violaceum TaxID=536 RepID=UPI00068E0526|nr:DMT family transporter [Chromobacterium violaceum]MBT2869218.1 DMT family transporter [Chromobacterium violaceum]OQS08153.1 EamA family transporter [Chromobacterium violaceum]OQS20445.1 EamA family transporter [Chromobacterium violaceum]